MTEEEIEDLNFEEKIEKYLKKNLTVSVNFYGSIDQMVKVNVGIYLNNHLLSFSSGIINL